MLHVPAVVVAALPKSRVDSPVNHATRRAWNTSASTTSTAPIKSGTRYLDARRAGAVVGASPVMAYSLGAGDRPRDRARPAGATPRHAHGTRPARCRAARARRRSRPG